MDEADRKLLIEALHQAALYPSGEKGTGGHVRGHKSPTSLKPLVKSTWTKENLDKLDMIDLVQCARSNRCLPCEQQLDHIANDTCEAAASQVGDQVLP